MSIPEDFPSVVRVRVRPDWLNESSGKGSGASRAFIIKSVRKHATKNFFRRGLTTAVFIGGRKGARLPREVHNI